MSLNNKKDLNVRGNASYKVVDGITYFKLRSEFDGDYTKNCGLLGEEVDANFYFLRGYDIDTIDINDDRELIITRIDKDYSPIIINLDEALGRINFNFDKEDGVINVIYPDGDTQSIGGFLVEGKNVKISTDHSLDGDGTMFNPLRVAPVETTGTYAPVEEVFDITTTNKMPIGKGKGYRIVTREKIDNFGCLYPLSAVKKIQDKLEESGSQWRVPTKNDWDELLNAMEIESEYRNHNSLENKWLGKIAGSALKSSNLWENYETLPSETPVNGQNAVGMSILPLGIGADRNEIIDDVNSDIEGFKKLGGFWSNTKDNTGNAYVKIFSYGSAQVDQDTYGVGSRFSIRLVKDYNLSNFNDIELILGLPYTTSLVYSICDDVKYAKIWTTINVYDSSPALGGVRSSEWDSAEDFDKGIQTVYFVNEWNGFEWSKKLMKDGDSVVVKNYNGKQYHEWRLINENLEDTFEYLIVDFNKQFNDIRENLETEIQNRISADDNLIKNIQTESELRDSGDTILSEKINSTIENFNNIINREVHKLTNNFDKLNSELKNENILREETDNLLNEKILKEISDREKSNTEIRLALETEIEHRKTDDNNIIELLNKERTERQISDEKESETRHANDIVPGLYELNETMNIQTYGENNISIKLSDDFFNFGPILNE